MLDLYMGGCQAWRAPGDFTNPPKNTVLCNHMRIVYKDMSTWTPLTMYLGMKTMFETFIMRI